MYMHWHMSTCTYIVLVATLPNVAQYICRYYCHAFISPSHQRDILGQYYTCVEETWMA